jgi:hypothetical protein
VEAIGSILCSGLECGLWAAAADVRKQWLLAKWRSEKREAMISIFRDRKEWNWSESVFPISKDLERKC